MASAVQPNSLGTLRKHFTNPSEQVAAPPSSFDLQLRSRPYFLLIPIVPGSIASGGGVVTMETFFGDPPADMFAFALVSLGEDPHDTAHAK